MTTTRRLAAVAFAAVLGGVLPFAMSGCGGSDCPSATPPIKQVPASCTAMAPSTTVTINLHVCPKCDQVPASCRVDASAAASSGIIQLDPLAQVCSANSSCPIVDVPSCSFQPLPCTFTTPAAAGNYNLLVVDENGVPLPYVTFTVAAAGTQTTCG